MIDNVIIPIGLLVIGFVLLVKGADYFVEGSASVAKKLRVPSLIIGMTIVAMGTSLPEFSVSLVASMKGSNSLAISNAVGSDIFNLMVVCGICALFVPLAVNMDTLKRDFPIAIGCAILLGVFGIMGMNLGRIEGIILLVLFILFLIAMIRSAIKSRNDEKDTEAESEEIKLIPGWKCALYIVGGLIAIKYGGDFVVDGATTIARTIGITETVIGLTIVAIGTSLPELVTSIVAAKKDEVDMAVGNVIGSNIFNILFVLGIAAVISPITFITENLIDIIVLVVFSAVIWIFSWTKKEINRKEGILMILAYIAYTAYILVR